MVGAPFEYVSDRLILRRFQPADEAFVLELHNNPDLVRFIPSAAMSGPQDALAWISRVGAETAPGRGWWCVTLHDGTPVGAVVLKPVRYSQGLAGDEVEIGWRAHPAHTGRGYSAEAGELLLAAGLAAGLERVIAVVDPENVASQAVCRRIGMTAAGRTSRYYDEEHEVFEATGGSATSRQVAWRGVDDPTRTDEANVSLDDGLFAVGRQCTPDYRAVWSVDARGGWITRRVSVAVAGQGWDRAITLKRDAETGRWSSGVHADGIPPADLAAPGIDNPEDLADALDCDLGLCPLTNTMPIRRLGLAHGGVAGLAHGGVAGHALTTAWIQMPSLAVTASAQTYAGGIDGQVTYISGPRGRRYELCVDADGLVVTYPTLARRVAG